MNVTVGVHQDLDPFPFLTKEYTRVNFITLHIYIYIYSLNYHKTIDLR